MGRKEVCEILRYRNTRTAETCRERHHHLRAMSSLCGAQNYGAAHMDHNSVRRGDSAGSSVPHRVLRVQSVGEDGQEASGESAVPCVITAAEADSADFRSLL